MEINEQKLIHACQAGDLEQFGFLYDKYIKKIYDFVYFKTHHRETAEDLTSQIFLKAVDKIRTFDVNKGTMQAWLYRIARNTVIDYYRTRRDAINIDDVWDLSDQSDIERDIDAKTKLLEVGNYLKILKSQQRDIVIMRIWQGLSHKEIAEALNKSEASVKMSFSRTMARLRQEMSLTAWLWFLLFPTMLLK